MSGMPTLADDPWMTMEVLRVASVEPWEVLLDGRVARATWGE
jgi:hypothetical protein